jgi:hypothetical protein
MVRLLGMSLLSVAQIATFRYFLLLQIRCLGLCFVICLIMIGDNKIVGWGMRERFGLIESKYHLCTNYQGVGVLVAMLSMSSY